MPSLRWHRVVAANNGTLTNGDVPAGMDIWGGWPGQTLSLNQ
mgnify:CR=1 FL=1